MNFLKWINTNLERILAASLLGFIVILITVNVIMRYIFNASLSWGEEATLWTFVWFIWIAVSFGFQKRAHIRITIIRDKLSFKWQILLDMIVDILMLIFFIILIYQGIKLINKPYVASQKSVVLGLAIPILYLSASVGATLSSLRIIQHFYASFKKLYSDTKGASS